MDFRNITIENISLKKKTKNSYNILYNNTNLEFYTILLFCPFGLEEKYNDFFINFKIETIDTHKNTIDTHKNTIDTHKNTIDNDFYDFLIKLELNIKTLVNNLEKSDYIINSQINKKTNMLYTKLLKKNNKVFCKYTNKDNENLNIYKIEKKKYYFCRLICDSLWITNNTIYFKYKIKELILNN